VTQEQRYSTDDCDYAKCGDQEDPMIERPIRQVVYEAG
jgi:hypothetical protein